MIKDVGIEGLSLSTQKAINQLSNDIKAEHIMTTQESFQALSGACDDLKKVILGSLGISRVIKFLAGVPTGNQGTM